MQFLQIYLIFAAFSPMATALSGKFLLVTDMHVDEKYNLHGNRDKMCHQQENEKRNETPKKELEMLGNFGDRDCDAPPALIDYMLDEAKKLLPNPDYIIWTGDTGAHIKYTKDEFLKTMEFASDAIRHRFNHTQVVPVLGNHDFVIGNRFPDSPPEELEVYERIFDIWEPWIGEEAKESFKKGGYYKFKSPLDGSIYFILNTNIYYVSNKALHNFTHYEDPTGQFAYLEREFAVIERNNESVHILGHVAPGGYEWNSYSAEWHAEMPKPYNKRLLKLFVKYAHQIRWMLFGHLHTDSFRIVKDVEGKPIQRIYLNPAITPMFGLNNPAFRVFEYNTTNFDIIDISTYYVNLDELNQIGANKLKVQLEYSMRQAYGLQSFDADSMNNLMERIRNDDGVFQKYIRFNNVMYEKPNGTKPDRAIHLCVLENLDLDRLKICVTASGFKTAISTMAFMWIILTSLFATQLL